MIPVMTKYTMGRRTSEKRKTVLSTPMNFDKNHIRRDISLQILRVITEIVTETLLLS